MAEELGLNQDSPYTWGSAQYSGPPARISQGERPIDFLRPNSPQHDFVRDYCLKRLRTSVNRMTDFHERWRVNEERLQAYVSCNDYEALLKGITDQKTVPEMGTITVPYAWATINTIVTYLLHMFGGRTPIFQCATSKGEYVRKAQNMELMLQYNADFVKFLRSLYFFLMDGETYGVGVLRTMWRRDVKQREVIVPPSPDMQAMMSQFGRVAQGTRTKQSYVSFEGSGVSNIDPFMFFPDPRVPMHEVNAKGEFVFWRAFEGRHILLREQAAGRLKWVDQIKTQSGAQFQTNWSGGSSRGIRARGIAHPGMERNGMGQDQIAANIQIDQGSIEIIPAEIGVGEGRVPEKWLVTIANESQIVQFEPLNLNHGRHPVVVVEPNSTGYAFGQLGTADMLGPFQDMISWFMNSHIYNVRAVLNNMLVVDPTKVEMQDLKKPRAGGFIRLKNNGFGSIKPGDAVHQLQVGDVTARHTEDATIIGRMADSLTGASDNTKGLQDAGGRKTATEVRTVADAGSSRLAAKGRLYSAMAMTDLAEQQSSNFQQFLSQEYELAVLGVNGQKDTIRIGPDDLAGEFFFPIHDGTLPIDKIGLLDVWTKIFQMIIGSPVLTQQFDVVNIFSFMAQLGGAQNIESFKIQAMPQDAINGQVQAGNMVPMSGLPPPPRTSLNLGGLFGGGG